MGVQSLSRRLRRLSWHDSLLFAEASVALAAAALAIEVLPFRVLARAASRNVSRSPPGPGSDALVQRLVWAVAAAAARLPWTNVCFQRGLALHAMLRRRGYHSRLHYGVGRLPDRPLSAHVWVSLDDRIIEGADAVPNHACLATFPAAAPKSTTAH